MVSSMRILGLRLLWLRHFLRYRGLGLVVCGRMGGGVDRGRSASCQRCGTLAIVGFWGRALWAGLKVFLILCDG